MDVIAAQPKRSLAEIRAFALQLMEQKGTPGLVLNDKLIERFQKGWMYSEGHRQNILRPEFTRFGFGIALNSARGEVYAVQMFALPPP